MALRGHDFNLTAGRATRSGFTKAQCGEYGAPCWIHRLRRLISRADNVRPVLGGGMMSSGSVAVMRRTSSLLAVSPGTIARLPLWSWMASSRRSRRSLAFRELSSGPWQLKHLLEMSGRICELKSTGSVGACFLALAPGAAPTENAASKVRAVKRARVSIERFMQFLHDECWQLNILYPFDPMKQSTRARPVSFFHSGFKNRCKNHGRAVSPYRGDAAAKGHG